MINGVITFRSPSARARYHQDERVQVFAESIKSSDIVPTLHIQGINESEWLGLAAMASVYGGKCEPGIHSLTAEDEL